MKRLQMAIFCALLSMSARANPIDELTSRAALIFEDDFNRSEKDDSVEDLGKQWRTNSKKNARGDKQADLRNGVLFIEMAKGADHGTSILHSAPFDDGIVKIKFKLLNEKDLRFNFNDPNAKDISHAGHVCQIQFDTRRVTLIDHLDGRFRKDIHRMRKFGTDAEKKKAKQLLKGKSSAHKVDLKINHWYEMAMLFQKDLLSVYIDDALVGKLNSPGFDHKMKDNFAFAIWHTSAEFDDLRIWSLD